MGCQGDLARRRRMGLRAALQRAGEAAQQRGCAAVSIGGDLLEHERSGVDTAQFLTETFASWQPMRVLLAAGNHDPLLPGSIHLRTSWPGNVHLFADPVLRPLRLCDGVTVWGLGHPGPAWTGDPLAIAPVGGDGGVHIALFHGAELGWRPAGKSIHGPFHREHIRDRGFAAALSGHYHRRRLDSASGLCYPGSPEPLSFDESEPRGPVLVEIGGDGTVSFEGLTLNRWHAGSVECDLDGVGNITTAIDRVSAAVLATTAGMNLDRTTLRVDLVGQVRSRASLDLFDAETAVRETTGIAALRLRDLTSSAAEIDVVAQEASARGAFVRAAREASEQADEDSERAIVADALRYGLQALAGNDVGLR